MKKRLGVIKHAAEEAVKWAENVKEGTEKQARRIKWIIAAALPNHKLD